MLVRVLEVFLRDGNGRILWVKRLAQSSSKLTVSGIRNSHGLRERDLSLSGPHPKHCHHKASFIPSSREGKALALNVFPAILSAERRSRDVSGCMWSTEVLCLLGVWCMERACVCGLSAVRLWCMCGVCISVHGICESVCGGGWNTCAV